MLKERLEKKRLKLERIMDFLKQKIIEVDSKDREQFLFKRMELMFRKHKEITEQLNSI